MLSLATSLAQIHGRSRKQRYTKLADWDYVHECVKQAPEYPVFGNGDIMSWQEAQEFQERSGVAGVMLARGALVKPWLFKEIKEQRCVAGGHEGRLPCVCPPHPGSPLLPFLSTPHPCRLWPCSTWDISSGERMDMLRDFTRFGLEHWGSDFKGVETTRKFLLEWLSFLYRYIPAGLLESLPQRINERPPPFVGRNDLETLMASPLTEDWLKIRCDQGGGESAGRGASGAKARECG